MPEFPKKAHLEDVYAVKKTTLALVCMIDDEEYVVPDSQIDDDSEVFDEGDEGTLVVNLWWAEKTGLA